MTSRGQVDHCRSCKELTGSLRGYMLHAAMALLIQCVARKLFDGRGARLIPAAILLALNLKALPALHTCAFISIRKNSTCINRTGRQALCNWLLCEQRASKRSHPQPCTGPCS